MRADERMRSLVFEIFLGHSFVWAGGVDVDDVDKLENYIPSCEVADIIIGRTSEPYRS